jgi:dihydrofolate synthase / folylpolyglutamate synthase
VSRRPALTYEEALEYIASLAPRGWRLGLDRMEEFVRRVGFQEVLGSPGGPQYIHVAGTNGKGSVTAYLQSMLVESGYRTGAFFSPYVYDPRERIQFGRSYIGREEFAGLTALLQPVVESFDESELGGVTEFEFKTALGFLFWRARQCEWVALEVGLGGRLDATNVVVPRASVIVSIGLDHTHLLGETHAEIAREKAGVIKPGIPVVVGGMPQAASEVIEAVALERGSPVWRWGREVVARVTGDREYAVETPAGVHEGLYHGLQGALQGHNLALAVAAMDAAGATRTLGGLMRGARSAYAPGRFQRVTLEGRSVILDGAHNTEAAAVLAESLVQHLWTMPTSDVKARVKVVALVGMVSGHDPEGFARELAPHVDEVHLTPIDFRRTLAPDELAPVWRDRVPTRLHESVASAWSEARESAGPDGIVLVTGSFYLLGEFGEQFGNAQER